MDEAQFEYKCRRCGEVAHNPCCDVDLAHEILHEIIMRGVGHDTRHGGRVYLHEPHYCAGGGIGLADLQGYRVVGEKGADNES